MDEKMKKRNGLHKKTKQKIKKKPTKNTSNLRLQHIYIY